MKKTILLIAILAAAGLTAGRAQDTWVQKADFGGTPRAEAVGFSIGNKGYIGTGNGEGGEGKDFWQYDPATDTWTQKADFGGGLETIPPASALATRDILEPGKIVLFPAVRQ